ncbi:unnamed protein product [Vitrella brassicaformis CCMP3155]|uniref:Uncharacterized protein n=2 Tax=Vitrella brassicaformis TaxID=1169539 RepID=A0A0G4ERQ1_VITBC|nr:unnamed protein product [Vitrella brassicaformis CCMP3155]|eukprot:CEM00525.1 unnamed protein product [Vitrella brassicaformis CCMP3155]
MGSSPPVMTLEEAGDRLIQAEKADKDHMAVVNKSLAALENSQTTANTLLLLLVVELSGAALAHFIIGSVNNAQLVAHEGTIKALQEQHLLDKDALIGKHEVAIAEKEAANMLLQDQLATATADLENKTAAIKALHKEVAQLTEGLRNTTQALQQRDKAIVALKDRFQASEGALARANERLKKWSQVGGGFVTAAMVPVCILSALGTFCSFCATIALVLGPLFSWMEGSMKKVDWREAIKHVFFIIGAAAALAFCIWALRLSSTLVCEAISAPA